MAGKTKQGLLAQELSDLNPWWRSDSWSATDRDLQAARGSGLGYTAGALDDLEPGGLYVLRGPRRVGKTVVAKQAIDSLIESGVPRLAIVRFAADGMSASDIRSIVQNVTLPRPPEGIERWWFIDEISGATGEWAKTIKWLRDNLPSFGDGTVVLTGSNAEALTEAIGEWPGRRGRIVNPDRTLLPIGFRTFTRLLLPEPPPAGLRLGLADLRTSVARDAFQALVPWLADLVRSWDTYLAYGGFPIAAAAAKRGEPIPEWFVNDIFTVIFKDVFGESRASETTIMNMFARFMEGMASPVNLTSIAEDSEVSRPTVTRHLDYLRNGYLAWACPQRSEKRWLALPGSQPKIYALDPLVARLSHLRNPARDDVDVTVLNEMMVGMALRRASVAAGHDWEGDDRVFHWRTPARKEIDFISELLVDVAIEGKFVDDGGWKAEARTVEASDWRGLLATRSVLDTSDEDEAWAVPSAILAYLVDL